jgi:hypothetical protein
MGHGATDTVDQYLKPLTPSNKATIEWINLMLDKSDAAAWIDDQVLQWEKEEHARRLHAKENSKRWRKDRKAASPSLVLPKSQGQS